MAKHKSAWGVEIGSAALKAIKLVATDTGVDIENYVVLPYKQVLSTPDVDAGEIVRLTLQEFLSRNELEGSSVVASMSGAAGVTRFATLPPVDPKRIPEIVKFEAVQQIPFPIDQAEWDYHIFQQADLPDVKVGVFAIARDRVYEFMANLNAANVELSALTLSPLGVFNAFSYDHKLVESRKCTAYVDIGTMATDVIIVEDNVPWVRTFPIGGHHLTEALVKQLKISYARAEEEKLGLATSKMGKQMLQAMRGVVLDLAQEISRSINYYQQLNRGSEVKRIVGVGSSFKLPGLVKFLSQNLPVEIERLEQFNRLEVSGRHGSRLVQHSLELATAYGLALQGLGEARVEANLLPRQVLLGRLWKSKNWWFIGAAACMAGAAAVSVGAWLAASASAKEVLANNTLNKVIIEADGYKDTLGKLKNEDPRAMSETLMRTQAYRDLYPRIVEDVAAVVAAVKAPPVLLNPAPDYEKIKAIPADQRTRLVVRKVEFNYAPPVPKTGALTLDPVATFGFSAASFPNPAFTAACEPPHISVVVSCSLPMSDSDASPLIAATVKPWLEAEQQRLEKAHTAWIAAQAAFQAAFQDQPDDEQKRLAAAELAKKCPDRLYRIKFNANDLFQRDAVVGPGAAAGAFGTGVAGGGQSGEVGLPTLAKLLPSRPDLGSDKNINFRMAWDLVLVSPEDARKELVAAEQPPPKPPVNAAATTPAVTPAAKEARP